MHSITFPYPHRIVIKDYFEPRKCGIVSVRITVGFCTGNLKNLQVGWIEIFCNQKLYKRFLKLKLCQIILTILYYRYKNYVDGHVTCVYFTDQIMLILPKLTV